jgi:hypothetical protein
MTHLFHTLVVCGAGLTVVGGGGRSESDAREPEPARGGSSSEGGSGSVGNGSGAVSHGGLMLTPAGAPSINIAGSSSLGGTAATMPGPLLPRAEGQWVCAAELMGCSEGFFDGLQAVGFALSSACAADSARPKSSDDCAGQGTFSCSLGFFNGQGVLFNCECKTPALNQGCPCPETGSGCYGSWGAEYCDELQAYCGCAMTCIAK